MPLSEHEALASALGAALHARGWLCAAAESCTGGLVAGAITDIAGSSAWFDRGFVTYSDDAKIAMLSVPASTIADHGAVSEATARAMAQGALAQSRAQIAVAITGIAGPGGAVEGKPVGTVCFAFAISGAAPRVETQHLRGDRAAVRRACVAFALAGLTALAKGG
ncbi:MAG: CinA family protein [Betaproteobacteria bacterium]